MCIRVRVCTALTSSYYIYCIGARVQPVSSCGVVSDVNVSSENSVGHSDDSNSK